MQGWRVWNCDGLNDAQYVERMTPVGALKSYVSDFCDAADGDVLKLGIAKVAGMDEPADLDKALFFKITMVMTTRISPAGAGMEI